MIKNKHIKIAIFLLMFLNVSIGQTPLKIRNGAVVGIGGIIVGETTLSEAIESFGENPHTVRNFQFLNQEGKHKSYESWQQINVTSAYTTIEVKNNIIDWVAVAIEIDDENMLQEIYRMTCQERRARLGYPSTETAGVRAWTYPNKTYVLSLYRDDTGKLQIFEMVGVNR